jgi:hypothetical protein
MVGTIAIIISLCGLKLQMMSFMKPCQNRKGKRTSLDELLTHGQ